MLLNVTRWSEKSVEYGRIEQSQRLMNFHPGSMGVGFRSFEAVAYLSKCMLPPWRWATYMDKKKFSIFKLQYRLIVCALHSANLLILEKSGLLKIFPQVVVKRSSRSNHVETSISFNLVKRVNGPKFLDVGHHIVRISDRKLARNSWLGDGSKRFTAATRYFKK
jgi:hypothetical protein